MDDIDDIINSMSNKGDNNKESILDIVEFVPKTTLKDLDEVRMDVASQGGDPLKVSEFDVMADALKNRHAERFNHILQNSSDREFLTAYLSVLPFIKPKFKPVEIVKPKPKTRTLVIRKFSTPEEVEDYRNNKQNEDN